jgi:hypothetical protein
MAIPDSLAKLYLLLFLFSGMAAQVAGQSSAADTLPAVHDTAPVSTARPEDTVSPAPPVVRKAVPADSVPHRRRDTLRTVPAATDSLRRHHRRDSLQEMPAARAATDSLRFSARKPEPELRNLPVEWMDILASNRYLNFGGQALRVREATFERESADGLFYLIVGLLFFYAVIRMGFSKYLDNLLTLFFRVSVRQQQLREQVLQSPVPALLLNLLFVLSGSLYADFFLQYMHGIRRDQFWTWFLYGAGLLTLIYLGKFIFLKITGWIFNISRATDTYLFIVFMTNKIIGIFLLPFLVILSFSGSLISSICFTGSALLIGTFYLYRLIAAYKSLRKEINISILLFFLYLCAFEIAPLLLIYKVLLTYWEKAV